MDDCLVQKCGLVQEALSSVSRISVPGTSLPLTQPGRVLTSSPHGEGPAQNSLSRGSEGGDAPALRATRKSPPRPQALRNPAENTDSGHAPGDTQRHQTLGRQFHPRASPADEHFQNGLLTMLIRALFCEEAGDLTASEFPLDLPNPGKVTKPKTHTVAASRHTGAPGKEEGARGKSRLLTVPHEASEAQPLPCPGPGTI